MGRGRVQLQRIENKISRQVTFSKRRNGLLKKAHEISVLCDARVALIVFSNKGKLFEFSSDSSMESIIDRYERHSSAEQNFVAADYEGNRSLEYSKLVSRAEALQRNLRHLIGEEIDALSLRELQNLEHQIDIGLKRVRSKKNQLIHVAIAELHKKEKKLQEQNNTLAKKVEDNERMVGGEQENNGEKSSSSAPPEAALALGGRFQMREGETQPQPGNVAVIPPWMLRAL